MIMKVSLGCDHGGIILKQVLIKALEKLGCLVIDHGCHDGASVDYPDYAQKVAGDVAAGRAERGVLLCGTGIGMAISANKTRGVRAAAITDVYSAQMTRRHNDLNVLCLGGRVVGAGLAELLVETFIKTEFEGGRHADRIAKME